MTRSGQGGFCPDPIHSSLLFCHFPGSFRFRSIAFSAFVLLKTCLRNQEPSVEQLTDSIGEVDMGFAFKQVVNGVRSRKGGRNLVGRRKCGTDIAASVPGHLGMIFEVQKELFFHLATKRLPCRTQGSRFDITTPEIIDFQLLLPSIPEDKLIWKLAVCRSRTLKAKFDHWGQFRRTFRSFTIT